jgi:hypothetical protein
MRMDRRLTGLEGELLFARLALKYWGEITYTPTAVGTDGYLRWKDLPANRLFVQIKSTKKRSRRSSPFQITIEAKTLREWFAFRPLLIRCILEEDRAWWLDTATLDWAPDTRRGKTFHIPSNQIVDAGSKTAIEQIALRLPRFLPPGISPAYAVPATSVAVVPPILRNVSGPTLRRLLEALYTEKCSIIERDGTALAAVRLLHANRLGLAEIGIDEYLKIVLARLNSIEPGGRSNTLIALASLLGSKKGYQFDASFLSILQQVIDRAVTAGTFVNPELGLVVGAFISAKFPRRTELSDHVKYLSEVALDLPATFQNRKLRSFAGILKSHFTDYRRVHPGLLPLDGWIKNRSDEPLRQDDPIFLRLDQATDAAWRILRTTPAMALQDDLDLFNKLTRLQASNVLFRLYRN